MRKKGFLNLKLILIVLVIKSKNESTITFIVLVHVFKINNLHEQELQSLSTTMLQIQAKAKVINERNKVNNTSDYIGKEISEEDLKKLNIEDNGKIRILSKEDLEELEVTEIKQEKDFVINYETEEVYYLDGYKTDDNNIVYSLTDISNLVVK